MSAKCSGRQRVDRTTGRGLRRARFSSGDYTRDYAKFDRSAFDGSTSWMMHEVGGDVAAADDALRQLASLAAKH